MAWRPADSAACCFRSIAIGAGAAYAYVLHARRTPAPVLDLSLLEIPTLRAAVVGGFVYRCGIGAMPFLLPLLLQLGFGLSAFESGLITLSNVVGAMGMKTVIPIILRHFGFKRALTVNALVSAALVGLCATFTPGVPFAWIDPHFQVGNPAIARDHGTARTGTPDSPGTCY